MFHDFYFGSVLSSYFFAFKKHSPLPRKIRERFFFVQLFYLSRARRGLFLVPEFKSPSLDASWKLFQVRRKKIEPMHYLQMNKKMRDWETAKCYVIKIVYQVLIIDLICLKKKLTKSRNIWKIIGLLSPARVSWVSTTDLASRYIDRAERRFNMWKHNFKEK